LSINSVFAANGRTQSDAPPVSGRYAGSFLAYKYRSKLIKDEKVFVGF